MSYKRKISGTDIFELESITTRYKSTTVVVVGPVSNCMSRDSRGPYQLYVPSGLAHSL